ncbi:hypothetical protein K435DRAFT_816962 [Dendrothele bispora CBS 962.96]|uniref:Glutathione S-transferase n=1 Tax=Dendrothele bispora (strain CBS 962.96) TaxID=1314807 RepID=A0A4S8MNA1_DENBC|nr:hypothetical protein K435DRAFT_816962 [Dendrothele bispora CBS 962.96]
MTCNRDSGKQYHKECTGLALELVKKRTEPKDITLFGSCFCPYVQRVWAAFEYLQIPYQYYEVDPYKKPKDLLELSPKGLVPALRLDNVRTPKALNESTVILEYINDLAEQQSNGRSLLPPLTNPYARALVRLQSDHISRTVIPAFFRVLIPQDPVKQQEGKKEFYSALDELVRLFERAEKEVLGELTSGTVGEGERKALMKGLGLWVDGNENLGMADVMVGPWIFRATIVLKYYRDFEMPTGEKFTKWMNKLFNHPDFKNTCSTEDLYLDSYEGYAYNRPIETSQTADAN